MVAVNVQKVFTALVLSTLLIQCFGAPANINTNLTEHDAMNKSASSLKPTTVLPPTSHDAAAAGVNDSSTEHDALNKNVSSVKPSTVLPSSSRSSDAAVAAVNASSTEHGVFKQNVTAVKHPNRPRPTLRPEHQALNKNASSVKPATVESSRAAEHGKLSNGVPSHRASGVVMFPNSSASYDDDYYDIEHHDSIGTATGDPGLPTPDWLSRSGSDVSSTTAAPASTTTQEVSSSTASVPATQEVSSTASVPAGKDTSTSSTPASSMPGSTTGAQLLVGDESTTDGNQFTSTAAPISDGSSTEAKNGAATITTISSLILVAAVNFLLL